MQNKYIDWLFVFGSIIAMPDPNITLPECYEDWKEAEVYNIVIVQKGAMGEEGCRIVMKEVLSNLDFMPLKRGEDVIPEDVIPTPLLVYLEPSKEAGVGRERQKKNYGGEGIFELDGICFGLEICADHYAHRLRKSAIARGNARVQIQIVPSAGAYITPRSVVAIEGGLVLNCDGLRSEGSVYSPNGISGHTDMKVVITAATGNGDAILNPVEVSSFKKMLYIANATEIANSVFFEGPGQLHFYPRCELPPASSRSLFSFWADYGA